MEGDNPMIQRPMRPTPDAHPSTQNVERCEEEKLRSKYPNLGKKGSSILQKRLNKNVKYFDSGDYNMARAKVMQQQPRRPVPPPGSVLMEATGETIPTPDNVHSVRKKSLQSGMIHHDSLVQQQFAAPAPLPTLAEQTYPPASSLLAHSLPIKSNLGGAQRLPPPPPAAESSS